MPVKFVHVVEFIQQRVDDGAAGRVPCYNFSMNACQTPSEPHHRRAFCEKYSRCLGTRREVLWWCPPTTLHCDTALLYDPVAMRQQSTCWAGVPRRTAPCARGRFWGTYGHSTSVVLAQYSLSSSSSSISAWSHHLKQLATALN